MYLLLVIFSIFNLNDVSWGTRDTTPQAQKVEEANKQALANSQKKKPSGIAQEAKTKLKGIFSVFSNLCTCIWGDGQYAEENKQTLNSINDSLKTLNDKIYNLEKGLK